MAINPLMHKVAKMVT